MTVIVWDRKTLAGDKLVVAHGAVRARGTKVKKVTIAEGNQKGEVVLLGYTGPLSLANAMFLWVEKGFEQKLFPEKHTDPDKGGTLMMVTRVGKVVLFDHSSTPWEVQNLKGYAVGACAEAAIVALHLGHKSAAIVRAINECTIICGEGVDEISFTTPRRKKT